MSKPINPKDAFTPSRETFLENRLMVTAVLAVCVAGLFALIGTPLDNLLLFATRSFAIAIPFLSVSVILLGYTPKVVARRAHGVIETTAALGLIAGYAGVVAVAMSLDEYTALILIVSSIMAIAATKWYSKWEKPKETSDNE